MSIYTYSMDSFDLYSFFHGAIIFFIYFNTVSATKVLLDEASMDMEVPGIKLQISSQYVY